MERESIEVLYFHLGETEPRKIQIIRNEGETTEEHFERARKTGLRLMFRVIDEEEKGGNQEPTERTSQPED